MPMRLHIPKNKVKGFKNVKEVVALFFASFALVGVEKSVASALTLLTSGMKLGD